MLKQQAELKYGGDLAQARAALIYTFQAIQLENSSSLSRGKNNVQICTELNVGSPRSIFVLLLSCAWMTYMLVNEKNPNEQNIKAATDPPKKSKPATQPLPDQLPSPGTVLNFSLFWMNIVLKVS